MRGLVLSVLLAASFTSGGGCANAGGSAANPDAGAREAAGSSPAGQGENDDAVILRVARGRAADRDAGPQELLLKVDYAAAARDRVDRPPLNVALVLDSSASMAESQKLVYTLKAARWVIENLSDRDTVAMVAFDDEATVLSGAGRVVNKPFLFHRLDEIVPRNLTNLSAGLLEGIAQVSSQAAEGQVRQVFLLTDGKANRGETEPAALRKVVQEARARGIGVSTFGVGSDFNETLIADMAAAGGGRYVYVRSPEQIPTAFKDELRGLLQVVAQNAVLTITVTSGGIGKVYGQLREEASASSVINIGDLRATESGFFLGEVRPARAGGGAATRVDVQLVYDDPRTAKRINRAIGVSLKPGDGAEDRSVALLASILDAVESAEAAVQGLDIERHERAQASFDKLYQRAREQAVRTRDQELLSQTFVLKHFMGELAAAEQAGLLHGHREAQEQLKKESHYLRYLLMHHRPGS